MFIVPMPNIETFRNSFSYQAPSLYNELDSTVRKITNEQLYKKSLKQAYLVAW